MSKTPSAKATAATSATAKPAAKTAHATSASSAPATTTANAKDPKKNTSGSIGGAYETYGTPQG